ncbi:uncharacterized protein LOC117792344 [Drosophila innubila]|uniref:uncharacterized protein LOC117792344 n=1 Tax=Drosophila innubila TaxID=198719 RepID=UPI00148DCBEB|nr:uncharacterized protein LOC117792344 [Drosophila innubila]
MSKSFSKISIGSTHSSAEGTQVEVEQIFPKKLAEFKVGPIYDDMGFTLNERLALRQAWRVIKPFERRYGKEIYFAFLMEHYKSFENFRRSGRLDLHSLHSHSLSFMRFISAVIEQKDPVAFHAMLSDMYSLHCRANVNPDYMEIIVKALISYILDKLKDVCSASLESGFQRLFDKFHAFYDEETNKGLSFVFRRSESQENYRESADTAKSQ